MKINRNLIKYAAPVVIALGIFRLFDVAAKNEEESLRQEEARKPSAEKLIAHRGLWKAGHIQNSIGGIKAALSSPYAGFELDIRQTKDGILILNHDETVGNAKIEDNNYEALSYGGWLPDKLDDMMEVCRLSPDKLILAEIKSGNEEDIADSFAKAKLQNPLIYQSFDKEICDKMISLTRKPVWLLSVNSDLDFNKLKNEGFSGVSLMDSPETTDRLLIERIHGNGLDVAFWTVNNPERARELMDWGADFIISDLGF